MLSWGKVKVKSKDYHHWLKSKSYVLIRVALLKTATHTECAGLGLEGPNPAADPSAAFHYKCAINFLNILLMLDNSNCGVYIT